MNIDDTIVAISSPPGAAPRGIVRLSGAQALSITDRLFHADSGTPVSTCEANAYLAGTLVVGPTRLPAAAYVFRAPRSYTRQDVVELHMIGSPGVLAIIVEDCLSAGARRAEAGEFTARAFVGGAMDFSQAHGVAGLIAARSDEQLRAAERLLHGALSKTALAAREELADLLSLVEGALDFADEPIEFITPTQLRQRLQSVHASLTATAAAGIRAERFERLPTVVLVGPPNAGKSSLLNRLAGVDRAICTPIAGTTRDVLSAPLSLQSTQCLLIDIAGREDAQTEIDSLAQAAAISALKDADLVLEVVDVTTPAKHMRDQTPCIVVLNKSDLLNKTDRLAALERWAQEAKATCFVSALTGEGCGELKQLIEAALHARPADAGEAAIALMAEHRDALESAIQSIENAVALSQACTDSLQDADLVAVELHAAADALGRLVGRDDTEELLGRIFSRFCVGK